MSEYRYRALVGVPSISQDGMAKPHLRLAEKTKIQKMCIDEAMWHWHNMRHVPPYPMPAKSSPDADRLAHLLMKRTGGGEVSAEKILNDWGRSRHVVFLSDKPVEHAMSDPRPLSRETGLIAYSVANPDGYYDMWEMPIRTQWNDISVESCKLASASYGTYHDMLHVSDVAWFGTTFMPDVAFCAYRNPDEAGGISYDELFRDDQDTKTWEHDLNTFFQQRIGLYGTVAMVECVC